MKTINDAKEFLNQNYKKGAKCPCCNQFVKEYKRSIYYRIARYLINLYHLDKVDPGKYFSVDEIGVKGDGDFAKLVYWGLIYEKENIDTKKRTSGKWTITQNGKLFVERKYKVQKYIHLLNGEARSRSGPGVDIVDCLGKHFNYAELMSI